MVTGIAGLVISIWTRMDQRREAKERQRDPYFTLFLGPPSDDGWRIAKLIFHNPADTGFEMMTVRAMQPASAILSPRSRANGPLVERNEAMFGRALDIDWQVEVPRDLTKAAAQASLFCKLPEPASRLSIRIRARMISATRREFTMQADAKITNPAP